jgi:hypothetical protein
MEEMANPRLGSANGFKIHENKPINPGLQPASLQISTPFSPKSYLFDNVVILCIIT